MFTAQQIESWRRFDIKKKQNKKKMGSPLYFYLYESSVRANLSHKSYTKTQTDKSLCSTRLCRLLTKLRATQFRFLIKLKTQS